MASVLHRSPPAWLAPSIASGGVTVLVLAAALPLLPSRLTTANYGADGGDLLSAVLVRGVAHPTGYPTYLLLAELFQRLPVGTAYWRGALFSAVSAALAAGLFSAWYLRFSADPKPAWLGAVVGLTWGLSPLFLSQAVIVEVYCLQALFAVLALWWAAQLRQPGLSPAAHWLLMAFALSFGLGLGNHASLLLFLPPVVNGWWLAWRNRSERRWVLLQWGAVVAGALVYLILPLRAQHWPSVNWGNPQDWSGFWWLVTAAPYRGLLLDLPPASLLSRAAAWFDLLRQQAGVIGLLVAATGAGLAGMAGWRSRLLWWVFLSYSLLAAVYSTTDSTAYLLPAVLALAAWIGDGLSAFTAWRWQGRRSAGRILALAAVLGIFVRLPATIRQVDPRTDTSLDDFAVSLLEAAPSTAIILTQSDPDSFSLWYHHYGLGERPDLAVVVLPLTHYAWYRQTLAHTYPDLTLPAMGGDWGGEIGALNPDHPVCRTQMVSYTPLELAYTCSYLSGPGGVVFLAMKK